MLTHIVESSPSGTLAVIIPIRNDIAVSQGYPRAKAATKKTAPIVTAMTMMMLTKCCISLANVVDMKPTFDARLAMRPITVRSDVLITTPVAVPG